MNRSKPDLARIQRVIEIYLPSSRGCYLNEKEISEIYAIDIVMMWHAGIGYFNPPIFNDYERIISSLKRSLIEFRKLNFDDRLMHDPILGLESSGGSRLKFRMKVEMQLEAQIEAFTRLAKEPREEPPTAKRNWKATAVAKVCRDVWADEHSRANTPQWLQFTQKKGAAIQPAERADHFAPISEHPDRPGPFGRFLEAILSELYSADEGSISVSAASSLRSLKEVTKNRGRGPVGAQAKS